MPRNFVVGMLFQAGVFFIGDRFEPFVGCVFAGDAHGQMGKPAVGGSSMPMLHVGGDVDNIARAETARGFAPFLIPAFTGHAYEQLSASRSGIVYVPVVAAARLEGDI